MRRLQHEREGHQGSESDLWCWHPRVVGRRSADVGLDAVTPSYFEDEHEAKAFLGENAVLLVSLTLMMALAIWPANAIAALPLLPGGIAAFRLFSRASDLHRRRTGTKRALGPVESFQASLVQQELLSERPLREALTLVGAKNAKRWVWSRRIGIAVFALGVAGNVLVHGR